MKKTMGRGLAILLILLAVFCLIVFILPVAHNTVFWLGFGFGAFAILFQAYVLYTSFHKKDAMSRFYGYPIARVGMIYLVFQVIISLAECIMPTIIPAAVALIINVIALAAALIGCITLETTRDAVSEQGAALQANVSAMREMQSLAGVLVNRCGDTALKEDVRKLAEAFRYSDPVSNEKTKDLEAQLMGKLNDLTQALKGTDTDTARKLCGEVTELLDERNRVCAMNK